ncbi:uncharacterized protein LOC107406056 isoform X1 [Ziziphus jujuba]|uniref:Uncharacterized protein LOC107406056 isoform X1 n=1 Tax=Ziziphus jujuba TaxID=326968 RepID=A0ABM3IVA9_ZIZJJ|nr:uncharacterized protein LOC107406056 isoform X1 [Ziziphus jujuba]XP_048336120.2 uncharacterized protein LOC107406056 isoform X1 [Ziziphus jujuba]
MDRRKCTTSAGAPFNFSNKMYEKAQLEKEQQPNDNVDVTGLDIDLREVYFLVMHFLSAGPFQRTLAQFSNELMEHRLLPRRYHAWFSRNGVYSEDDNDDGISYPLSYAKLEERYPHVEKDHLVKLLKQLIVSAAPSLHGKIVQSAPYAAIHTPTLLGTGSFSLVDSHVFAGNKGKENKQVKPAAYLHWPHMQADQVHGLALREIGGGFTKHHRAPSVRAACYAIAKPSTMVQKMETIKQIRGHRDAVYCAIFDRSGRYVITGSDDRLVKIWSMETALCLASCRGHEGDITDLAVSSNNCLVASSSNDFVIRVWRLPDGYPISVLQGHTGAVTAIAFSPRPTAVYQLLSSSDDGTCRIWDARYSQCNPRIYLPKPSDNLTGKNNGPSNDAPSSSNVPQSHQILCCAYNANGTVFVTGSSDTFARVWSALKSNADESEQPIHEMDVLIGHENDVNYVQFSGCAVASKSSLFDSSKDENIPKFKNSWFCHDNIVTCSRDGSAIIWGPMSRRSRGKVGRWKRAYHLKVPPPPLPPQPPRGGPRQRFLPTPRGVNMIVWSLDNRFVLAAIMDCRICVWNAVDGSLVHSLTGHTASSYVLDVHPFNPRIAMSAGYDGRIIVWDIWEGTPIRIYPIGNKLVDGKFSADGTSIVVSDDVGRIYFINTGQGESQKDAKDDQFFLGDYRPVVRDASGNILDQETQLPAFRRNIQDLLCDSSMMPYPEPYQSMYQRRRLGALGIEWQPSTIKFAVGLDVSLGLMPPLADLERMIEPLPEFIDAMFWEPENEAIIEDSDSEYHVTEENSSEGEKRSISAFSSSDTECSAEDSEAGFSHKDGLRRSRRKTHKIKHEMVTSSGRRIKKRILDEPDGTVSGSTKSKKAKTGHKVLKRKSKKAKMSRPQRVAARNARSMLSQFTGTSTDGGDEDEDEDDSEYDSSENESVQQDLNIQSNESDMSLQNMCQSQTRNEELSLHESKDVAKLPLSVTQSNVGNKLKLVLKLPRRDSKKQEPLEDTKTECDSQADFLNPISQTTAKEKRIDGSLSSSPSLFADVSDVELSEYHNRTELTDAVPPENVVDHMEASAGKMENKIRWGEVKMRTSKRSRLGDCISVDEEFSHPDQHNPRSEHKQKYSVSVSASSFNGNLDKVFMGQAAPEESIEESVVKDEASCMKHSNAVNEDTPLNSTKLYRTKLILKDPGNPSKLKFVSAVEDMTNPVDDMKPENLPCMEHDAALEQPVVVGDTGRSSSLQLLYKARTDSEGLDGDSIDLHDSGNNFHVAASDAIPRTRSLKMKATSRESKAVNHRKNYQTAGTSKDAEAFSAKMHDQLPQRSRSSRNHQGSRNTNIHRSSAQRMSNHPTKKLSWLMLSEHEDGYRYVPQLGDEVVYMRQGHQEYIELSRVGKGPWRSVKGDIGAVEICKVEGLAYKYMPYGDSCCEVTLKFVDPSSNVFGKTFKLTLPELNDFPDFVVEKTWYDAAVMRNWTRRDKCLVWWKNEGGDGGNWWEGRIVSSQAKSPDFPDSPWLRYVVQYRDESGTHEHCPWELHDPDTPYERPHIDSEIRDKLLYYFSKVEDKEYHVIQQMNEVVEKDDFCNRFQVHLYPELIKARLEKDYYRNVEAAKHDIMVMLDNAQSYFLRKELATKLAHLHNWFTKKLNRL